MSDKRVVIVDDEPHIVEMFSSFLTMKGYQTFGAYTGEEGVAVVQMEVPDALLLDLMLPDIDGFEVCRRLRAMPVFASLPILIVSARTDDDARERAAQAGATIYLTKPVRFPDLLRELELLLEA